MRGARGRTISVLAAALLLATQHPTMPKGMSHEEHLKQMEKDEALKKRGAEAVGFDQNATTHHFQLAPAGGSIEVTVKKEEDDEVIAAVRSHLRSIAADFARGAFDKPSARGGPCVSSLSDHRAPDRGSEAERTMTV